MISDNLALDRHQGAHRFIPWGALVAIVVRERAKGSIDTFWCLVVLGARHIIYASAPLQNSWNIAARVESKLTKT